MHPFSYVAITQQNQAIDSIRGQPNAKFLAGGTNLLDDMKLGVENPDRLIDINALPLTSITATDAGGLRIGAMVRNSDLAWHADVQQNYPVLSQALLSGASAQLRNMATTGGNLLQRTRCYYFRDPASPCNKRQPGSGCSAIDGYNRIHALLGTSDQCIATHPSDMCVAMAALEAVVLITGPNGDRRVPFNEFHIPYGEDPAKETVLAKDELITAVELPPLPMAKRSLYLKIRDRASYEFALASAAVAVEMDSKTIKSARVALGGVATKPWRSTEAEAALAGRPAHEATYRAAADAALKDAKPRAYNAFKVELAKRTIVKALTDVVALA